VNKRELNGNYAFTFSGMSGNGSFSSGFFAAVEDSRRTGVGISPTAQLDTNAVGAEGRPSLTGTYSLAPDIAADDSEFFGQLGEACLAMLANGTPSSSSSTPPAEAEDRLGDHGKKRTPPLIATSPNNR